MFRNYIPGSKEEQFYLNQHTFQTYSKVQNLEKKYLTFDHFKMDLYDALLLLDSVKDQSDPDLNISQLDHALQTAEDLRNKYPNDKWLHLTGLIHDLGKILCLIDRDLQQWFIVGDTFPVGCPFDKSNIFYPSFRFNKDFNNSTFNTGLGIYSERCGLMEVKMSFGHDEYLYQVLKHNIRKYKLEVPLKVLYIIRFHSFYSWHSKSAYMELCNELDEEMLKEVQRFNKCDLYSKDNKGYNSIDKEILLNYYRGLIKELLSEQLEF